MKTIKWYKIYKFKIGFGWSILGNFKDYEGNKVQIYGKGFYILYNSISKLNLYYKITY